MNSTFHTFAPPITQRVLLPLNLPFGKYRNGLNSVLAGMVMSLGRSRSSFLLLWCRQLLIVVFVVNVLYMPRFHLFPLLRIVISFIASELLCDLFRCTLFVPLPSHTIAYQYMFPKALQRYTAPSRYRNGTGLPYPESYVRYSYYFENPRPTRCR